ncbi:MAG: transglutaminase family protein [Candidatus Hydrogenedentes bacterium]|nr:transglutaminase family protein [Candidatus Hydrogenedentota bacterium]
MNYRVSHTTRYDYDAPVPICYNRAHLTPRNCPNQRCISSRLEVQPRTANEVFHHTDYFGNLCSYFTVQKEHSTLIITVISEVEVQPLLTPEPTQTPPWEEIRDEVLLPRTLESNDASQFVFASSSIKPNDEMAAFARPSFPAGQPVLLGAIDLMQRIYAEFAYDPTATTLATPLEEVLKQRRGVCQDFAQLQIACLRSLGIPARYVSGYIVPTSSTGALPMLGAQASHAWLSVYTGNFGWVDLDPTNNLIASDEHITLAWGRDYDEVCPIRGVMLGGGNQYLSVGVSVERINGRGALAS